MALEVAKKAEAEVASADAKVVVLLNIRLRLVFFCVYWISVAIADWGGHFTTGRARRRVESRALLEYAGSRRMLTYADRSPDVC